MCGQNIKNMFIFQETFFLWAVLIDSLFFLGLQQCHENSSFYCISAFQNLLLDAIYHRKANEFMTNIRTIFYAYGWMF